MERRSKVEGGNRTGTDIKAGRSRRNHLLVVFPNVCQVVTFMNDLMNDTSSVSGHG